jgi:hypothetical protein
MHGGREECSGGRGETRGEGGSSGQSAQTRGREQSSGVEWGARAGWVTGSGQQRRRAGECREARLERSRSSQFKGRGRGSAPAHSWRRLQGLSTDDRRPQQGSLASSGLDAAAIGLGRRWPLQEPQERLGRASAAPSGLRCSRLPSLSCPMQSVSVLAAHSSSPPTTHRPSPTV